MTCGAAAVAACHQNQNGVPKLGGWTTPMVGTAYWVRAAVVMHVDNTAANSSTEIGRLIIASTGASESKQNRAAKEAAIARLFRQP